ncbi:MAG: hypothetical protein ACUVR2_11270 [Anaerolineae bacterium]
MVRLRSWLPAGPSEFIIVVLFVLFLGIGLILSSRALSYPWFWDDIHLIRSYTSDELGRVFVGAWDTDGIETSGYRPMTTVFNHVRALLLGENVVAHRILVIVLFALSLVLFCALTDRMGIAYPYAVLAGVLALCSRYNWFNLVWIADGIHVWTVFCSCSPPGRCWHTLTDQPLGRAHFALHLPSSPSSRARIVSRCFLSSRGLPSAIPLGYCAQSDGACQMHIGHGGKHPLNKGALD